MVVKPSLRWKDLVEPSKFQKNLVQLKKEKTDNSEEILDLTEGDPVIFGHTNQPLTKYLMEAANQGLHMYPEQTPLRTELPNAIHDFEKTYRDIEYDANQILDHLQKKVGYSPITIYWIERSLGPIDASHLKFLALQRNLGYGFDYIRDTDQNQEAISKGRV